MAVRIEMTNEEATHVRRLIEKGMERILPESLREYGVGVVQQIDEQLQMIDRKPKVSFQLTFKTAGMPNDMFSDLYEQEHVIPDGVGKYTVGYFVKEAEEAADVDKAGYPPEDIEKSRRIDNYFIAGGAKVGQTIFIEHG